MRTTVLNEPGGGGAGGGINAGGSQQAAHRVASTSTLWILRSAGALALRLRLSFGVDLCCAIAERECECLGGLVAEGNLHAVNAIDGGVAGRCAAQRGDRGIGNEAHVHEVVLHGFRQVEGNQVAVSPTRRSVSTLTCRTPWGAGRATPSNYDRFGRSSVYDHFGRNRKCYCGLVLFRERTSSDLLQDRRWFALQPRPIDPFRTFFIACLNCDYSYS